MTSTRRAIHAFVDFEAYDRLMDFAVGNGVSLTGVLQAIADELADEMEAAGSPEVRPDTVRRARRIDADRRRRTGGV